MGKDRDWCGDSSKDQDVIAASYLYIFFTFTIVSVGVGGWVDKEGVSGGGYV